MRKSVCVIEVGSSSLRGLITSYGSCGNFITEAESSNEYEGYMEGEFIEPFKLNDHFCDLLLKLETLSGEKIRKVYVSVPAEFSAVQIHELTKVFKHKHKINQIDINTFYTEMYEKFNDNDMEIVGISASEYILDEDRVLFTPLDQKAQKVTADYCVVTADRNYIRLLNNIIEGYGVEEVEYISETLCKSLFVIPEHARAKNICLLVDIGALSSSIAFVHGNGIMALTSFSLGGNHITNDLCEAFEIEYNDAETLKRQLVVSLQALPSDKYELITFGGRIVKIPSLAVNEVAGYKIATIADVIKQCVRENGLELTGVDIYLTGKGLTGIEGAKNYLVNLLNKEVKLGIPNKPYIDKIECATLYSLANYVLKN